MKGALRRTINFTSHRSTGIRVKSTMCLVPGYNIRSQTTTAPLCKWRVGLNLCRCIRQMLRIYGQCQCYPRIRTVQRKSPKGRDRNSTSTRGTIPRIAVDTTAHGWHTCKASIPNIQKQSSTTTSPKSRHVSPSWLTMKKTQRTMETLIFSDGTQSPVKGWFNSRVAVRCRITTEACS